MNKYKLGLVSISFRNLSPEELLQEVKHAGLSCIEWGSDVHAPCDDIEKVKQVAELQQKHGIECCSYGSYFRLGADDPSDFAKYINAAKILGTHIIRVWCGTKGSKEYSENELEALYSDCKRLAEIAEENGVYVCLECHNNTLTDTLQSALRVMKTVNSKHFCMYWQPNQYKTDDENLEYAAQIAEYTRHIHVFNWSGEEKYPLQEAEKLWKEYLSKFRGDRALLLEFMPDGKIETLGREADSLRRIIGVK